MITMPLAGCIDNDEDSSDTPDGELSDWNVHFAATVADLPTCNEDTNGRLYYVEADGQFQVCKTAGWEVIAIQGADGQNGTDGTDGNNGNDGADGAQGSAGPDGNDGTDGNNVLIETSTEPAGNNCANGGVKIMAGTDDNSDGVLQSSEVDSTQYICDGGSSATTMLTSYSTPPTYMNCDIGGSVIAHGLDNGDGGGTAANGQLESGEVDYSTTFCTKSTMLRIDINPGSGDSNPSYLTVFNNELYFRADDGTNGNELWKYDGTNAPSMVANINPGSGGSYPDYLTVFNNELYFQVNDVTYGKELWKYDGTNAPSMVAGPCCGSSESSGLTVFNNELYFSADDGTNGLELWKYTQQTTITYA